MNFLDNNCFLNCNVDLKTENSLISLASQLNYITNNNPDIDFSFLTDNVGQLVKTIDSLSVINSDLTAKNVDLTCEIAHLNDCLDNCKKDRRVELNESLHIQDAIIEKNEAMSRDLITHKNKIKKLQASLEQVKKENEKLKVKLSNYYASELDLNVSDKTQAFNLTVLEKNKSLQLLGSKLNCALEEKNAMDCKLKNLQEQVNRLKFMTTDKWLDDSVIQSYFSSFNSYDTSLSSGAIFVGPTVSELLKHSSSEIVLQQLEDLKLSSFKYAFFCVNNNDNLEWKNNNNSSTPLGNGSHWSLLFVNIIEKVAYHLDSLDDCNVRHALQLAEKLNINKENFHSVACQKQNNNFECGLNVILNAKLILHAFCLHPCTNFTDWYQQFSGCSSGGKPTSQTEINHSAFNNTSTCSFQAVSQTVVSTKPKVPALKLHKLNSKEWSVVKSPKLSRLSKKLPTFRCTDVPIKNTFSVLDSLHSTNTPSYPDIEKSRREAMPTENPNKRKKNVSTTKKCKSDHVGPTRTKLNNVHPQNNSNTDINNKKCVKIISDSHGRFISAMLGKRTLENTSVFGLVKPNAKYNELIINAKSEASTMTESDCLVLIGGCNDIVNGHCIDFLVGLENFLATISPSGPKVFLVGIPFRYDYPFLNSDIYKVNLNLIELAAKHANTSFISLEASPRNYFTKHGLHFNQKGKKHLSNLLFAGLNGKYVAPSVSPIIMDSKTPKDSNISYKMKLTNPRRTSNSYNKKSSINQSKSTFQNSHFLGEALKPPGVPWSHYLGKVLCVSRNP